MSLPTRLSRQLLGPQSSLGRRRGAIATAEATALASAGSSEMDKIRRLTPIELTPPPARCPGWWPTAAATAAASSGRVRRRTPDTAAPRESHRVISASGSPSGPSGSAVSPRSPYTFSSPVPARQNAGSSPSCCARSRSRQIAETRSPPPPPGRPDPAAPCRSDGTECRPAPPRPAPRHRPSPAGSCRPAAPAAAATPHPTPASAPCRDAAGARSRSVPAPPQSPRSREASAARHATSPPPTRRCCSADARAAGSPPGRAGRSPTRTAKWRWMSRAVRSTGWRGDRSTAAAAPPS